VVQAIDPYPSAEREAVHILALVDHELETSHLVLEPDVLRSLLAANGVQDGVADTIVQTARRRWSARSLDRRRKRSTCPECGGRVVPVVGGMVIGTLWELAEYNLVDLPGCVVSDFDPTWRCVRCGHSDARDEGSLHAHVGDDRADARRARRAPGDRRSG
jgi:hypothetical protein